MTFTSGSTGGEYSHKLTVDELASHGHQTAYSYGTELVATNGGGAGWTHFTCNSSSRSVSNTGGNKGHNNMPPWEGTYYWRRTA